MVKHPRSSLSRFFTFQRFSNALQEFAGRSQSQCNCSATAVQLLFHLQRFARFCRGLQLQLHCSCTAVAVVKHPRSSLQSFYVPDIVPKFLQELTERLQLQCNCSATVVLLSEVFTCLQEFAGRCKLLQALTKVCNNLQLECNCSATAVQLHSNCSASVVQLTKSP